MIMIMKSDYDSRYWCKFELYILIAIDDDLIFVGCCSSDV